MVSYCTHPVRRCFSSTFPPTNPLLCLLFCWYNLLPVCWLTDPHSCVWLAALHVRVQPYISACHLLCVFVCVPSSVCLCMAAKKTVSCPSGFSRKQLEDCSASVTEHKWLVKRFIYSLTLCLSAFCYVPLQFLGGCGCRSDISSLH